MINSKGIRILCYITMGLAYAAGIALAVYGISMMDEKETKNAVIFLVIGALIPFAITLALYPIFALSLIESHTVKLNDNMSLLLERINSSTSNQQLEPTTAQISTNPSTPAPISTPPSSPVTTAQLEDVLSFINHKYNTQINATDTLEIIKEKISKIDDYLNLTRIFKNRINEAESLDEVFSIMKMHRAALNSKL